MIRLSAQVNNRQRRIRKKICFFCAEKIEDIDYKNVEQLNRCFFESSKIRPRRASGICAKHQRKATIAIKRARQIALLSYVGGN